MLEKVFFPTVKFRAANVATFFFVFLMFFNGALLFRRFRTLKEWISNSSPFSFPGFLELLLDTVEKIFL